MTKTLLLFDIDGTLLKAGGAGMRAMRRAGGRVFGDGFRWDGLNVAGSLDPLIVAQAAQNNGLVVNEWDQKTFREQYLLELEQDLARNGHLVKTMPGVHDLLDRLRRRARTEGDLVVGMLTGNYRRAVPLKLATINVDPAWFRVMVCGDEAPTRPDLVGLAMRRYEVLTGEPAVPSRVVVIGDTLRDVACAQAHGCVAFAVATGEYGMDELQAAGAEHVVPDLSDPTRLLAMLEGGA